MTTVFDIRDAQLTLGTHRCLDNLCLSITHGQRIGLMGQNGSGKSSLIKCLANELSIDSGRIITNRNLSIHYLSQNLPESEKTVEDFLQDEHSSLSQTDAFWIKDIELSSSINCLSGGQKQRLKILKAIKSNADVFFIAQTIIKKSFSFTVIKYFIIMIYSNVKNVFMSFTISINKTR